VLINFANIARVYLQNRETQQASSCYLKALDLLSQIYGHKMHINASFCYSSLAGLYYETGEYRRSVEYQSEAVSILMKTLPSDDPRNVDAQKILKVYRDLNQSQPRMLDSR
jgi:tetratricopeptide (TPR) repeat protein